MPHQHATTHEVYTCTETHIHWPCYFENQKVSSKDIMRIIKREKITTRFMDALHEAY